MDETKRKREGQKSQLLKRGESESAIPRPKPDKLEREFGRFRRGKCRVHGRRRMGRKRSGPHIMSRESWVLGDQTAAAGGLIWLQEAGWLIRTMKHRRSGRNSPGR